MQKKWSFGLLALLVLAAAIRLWDILNRPGFEWDEPVYASVASNLLNGNGLEVKGQYGVPSEPYLYHPPFYFNLLRGWYWLFGEGIGSARVLAAVMSLVTLVLVYAFFKRAYGRWAMLPVVLLATDGWMVFTNRIGWIENTMMVLALLGLWLYCRADESGRNRDFVLAGVAIGACVIFKHVAAYVLLAVVINWFIQGRHSTRQHFFLLASSLAVFAVYLLAMTLIYSYDGGNHYWDQFGVQFDRTTGSGEARGTLENPNQAFDAIFSAYYVFYATIILGALSVGLVVWRVVQAVVTRSLQRLKPVSLAFSWALSALVFFGLINLKFPHYFLMAITPLYIYLSAEVVQLYKAKPEWGKGLGLALAIVVGLNIVTFGQRIVGHNDNALEAVKAYTAESLPPNAVVVTEESVGTIIPQPYCKLHRAGECRQVAQYLIIYTSITQSPPDTPAIEEMMQSGQQVAKFSGFKEDITVYRLP